MKHTTLKWGVLGTGKIALKFAHDLAQSKTGALVAIGSRTVATARQFGAEFGISDCHGSYETLLADPEVEAVYIATPHPQHAEWAIKAADAGKHILCEKPLTMNHAEAVTVIDAARRNDVFLMEAFMYRCHPQTARLVELLREKRIGEVRVIQATFSFHAPIDLKDRLFSHALGGGVILDVGCYCMSMARLIAGVAQGRDFAEPIEITGTGHIGEQSRVDEYAIASLKFPGDILASLSTGMQSVQENVVRIFGSEGWIHVPVPWQPGRDGLAKLIVHQNGEREPREIEIRDARPLFAIEADMVADNIPRREAVAPGMSWDDSLGNMAALDAWRAAIGLKYDSEQPGDARQG